MTRFLTYFLLIPLALVCGAQKGLVGVLGVLATIAVLGGLCALKTQTEVIEKEEEIPEEEAEPLPDPDDWARLNRLHNWDGVRAE